MELDTHQPFDWANDAFVTLNDINSLEKWPALSNLNRSFSPPSFTVPPSLVSHASIERYGQLTPPDELSPAAPNPRSIREDSIPVEQLQNEVSWPVEQQIRSLANYDPSSQQQPQPQPQHQQQQQEQEQGQQQTKLSQETAGRASKRRRASSKQQQPANQSPADPASQQRPDHTTDANPSPPKRKRGRPKSQPQTVEAFTSDGFPFQVTSARQSHLEKNRVAAHKCRQRKKEYINGLESRAREYSGKNKALKESVALLREEVLELKNEVLRHAGCGFWAVDEYLARCAGDLLGIDNPNLIAPQKPSHVESPTLAQHTKQDPDREMSIGSTPSLDTTGSQDDEHDDFEDMLNDMEDDMDGL